MMGGHCIEAGRHAHCTFAQGIVYHAPSPEHRFGTLHTDRWATNAPHRQQHSVTPILRVAWEAAPHRGQVHFTTTSS